MSPLRALGTRRLEGERVLLRPFTMGDVEDSYLFMNESPCRRNKLNEQ